MLLMEMQKTVQLFCITSWQCLIMLNIHSSYDSAISHLGVYPREMNACVYTKTWTWIFKTALFLILQCGNNPVGSQKEWNVNVGNNMGESQKLYAKWKSRAICSLILFIWNTENSKTKVTVDWWYSVAVINERSPTKTQEKTVEDEGTALYVDFGGDYTITQIHRTIHLK